MNSHYSAVHLGLCERTVVVLYLYDGFIRLLICLVDAEEYYTPPSSPEKDGNALRSSCGGGGDDGDGDDMSTPEEGPIVFIQG